MFLSSQLFNNLWNEATFKASFMHIILGIAAIVDEGKYTYC